MSKGYKTYLVVFSVLGLVGAGLLVKKTNELKANFDALDASITNAETQVPQQVASNDTASPGIAEPALIKTTEPETPAIEHPADDPKPEPPTPVTGFAPTNRQTTGPRYTNANLVPAGTPPPAPVDTSPAHIIIEVGRRGQLDLNEAVRDKRLNCKEISPGRLSCAQ